MNAASEIKPIIEEENQPVPPRLPVSGREKMAAFKAWQKLPFVWMPPAAAPPQPEDCRDWGINE